MYNIRFRLGVLNQAYRAVKSGSMTRDQYSILYTAMQSRVEVSRLQRELLEANSKNDRSPPVPMMNEGGVSKIDWSKFLDRFMTMLPIILQFITLFASRNPNAVKNALAETDSNDSEQFKNNPDVSGTQNADNPQLS